MKVFLRSLAAIVFLVFAGIIFFFLQFRSELHQVYVAPDPYTAAAPADADLVVVEFVDYNCEACRILHPILKEAIDKDGKIRYIPRPVSQNAKTKDFILFLYAAARQNGFNTIHQKIFELWPIEDIDVLMKYAESVGFDVKKLEEDMKNPMTEEALQINQKYFEMWGLGGTPVVLIATKVMGTKAIYRPLDKLATVDEFLHHFQKSREWF